MRQPEPAVGLDDVAELRMLLRRSDVATRQLGLALLRGWSTRELDAVGARAVLEAAGGSYPAIAGDPEHPAELLAQLLWDSPHLVEVPDVLRIYLIAEERARQALVHLLAIRGGEDGLAALAHLFGAHSPAELLPAPTVPVLDPLLAHPDREGVVELLIEALARPRWTWHAADLLRRIEAGGPSDEATTSRLLTAVAASVSSLVDACNRSMLPTAGHGDSARSDREALAVVMTLLDQIDGPGRTEVWLAMLASADPRVAAMGVARLLAAGAPVAPERLGLIARDPVARADLHDAALRTGTNLVDLDEIAVAEGRLVRWLTDPTELGRPPDELEFATTVRAPGPSVGELHLFRFRMHAPHWSAARGWMIGVGGAHTATCYVAEDEATPSEHVTTILSALADWPDRPADGAA